MILFIFYFSLNFILSSSRYIINSDIVEQAYNYIWQNEIMGESVSPCFNRMNQIFIGSRQSESKINWKTTISIPQSSKLNIYLEFKISGQWNNAELQIYANNIKEYSKIISFNDINRDCSEKFLYESYAYFTVKNVGQSIQLEIRVNQENVGLYISNLILHIETQRGRNEILQYNEYIKNCPQIGMIYQQYYCQCEQISVQENDKCVPNCDQGYIYNEEDNFCYFKQHCSQCDGQTKNLLCDQGYYSYQDQDVTISKCLTKCPNTHYQDQTTYKCLYYPNYLSQQLNGGYPVNHQQFLVSLSEFLYYFNFNDIKISIISQPEKIENKQFFFKQNTFYIGTFDTFKYQSILLTVNVINSQHKIIFKGVGHFIDFQPIQLKILINNVQYTDFTLEIDSNNQLNQDKPDYLVSFDLIWTRTIGYPLTSNQIEFQIEQEMQNEEYLGYFYLEDIQIYSFECETGCKSCFTYEHCSPCLFPQNKNLQDCSCVHGYVLQNHICIQCPSFCVTCLIQNQCIECRSTTLRFNPPKCDNCPDNYYLDMNLDDCQPCLTGCKKCIESSSCNYCQKGYFRTQNNSCQLSCPDNYYQDTTNLNDPKCSPCDSQCSQCEQQPTKCTECKENAQLYNNICYSCQDGQYLQELSCNSCISNCQTCISNLCTFCSESYYYKQISNQCVSMCDDGYYGDQISRICNRCNLTCETCLAGTEKDCLTCPLGTVLNVENIITGSCQINCLFGFYKVENNCLKCWKGCYSCVDQTQACLVCKRLFFRLIEDGNCYEKCPNGYYGNNIGNFCSTCNQICKTCDGFSEQNCLSCNQPLAYYQNQCLSECPDGYGNINAKCEQCSANCKSCVGTLANQCLKCNLGFYFLKNQCYLKCPKSFVGVRPQYVCKCIYENCVSCTSTYFFLNNICYSTCPYGYFGYNGLCIRCDLTCNSCFGEEIDQCLTCKQELVLFKNTCILDCLENTYQDLDKNECFYCNQTCLACNGPNYNQCTACPNGKLLTQQKQCEESCPSNQYAVFSEQECFSCDESCLTCFGPSNKNCLTCSNYFYLFECVNTCPDGFSAKINSSILECQPDFAIVINQCSYQCETCELSPRYCKKCAANRAANPPNCNCESGYFDDGINSNCLQCANKCFNCKGNKNLCITCKGDRILPRCDCPQYFYDDQESVYCTKCQDNCYTCDSSGCLECLGNRINSPDCVCAEGYYEAYTYYCKECSKQCKTCFGSAKLCSSCSIMREDPPVCKCISGYFENSDLECQQCHSNCIDCNEFGCLSCFGNRVGPVNGECKCNNLGVSRYQIGSVYCTDCQLGVPFFGLNDDFTGFTIDFGAQVQLISEQSSDLCSFYFDKITLQLLGNNPSCDINLNILFGSNTQIKIGDSIKLNNVFQLMGCQNGFQKLLEMTLSIPNNIEPETRKPMIIFKELSQVNICDETIISFDKLYFNGGQKFNIISWDKILPDFQITEIEQILEDATKNKNDTIIFPPKILYNRELYKFSVTVESFAKLQNTINIQFTTYLKSQILFEPETTKNQFHRFEKIIISNKLSYSNCFNEDHLVKQLHYDIIYQNRNQHIFNGTIIEDLKDGFQMTVPLQFDEYYFKFDNPQVFVVNLELNRIDYNMSVKSIFNIIIVPSIPTLTILDGNRMVGYTQKIYLNTSIKDKDLTQQEAMEKIYTCFWTCMDIVNNSQCRNTNQDLIVFNNECNQTIPAKSFYPYSVFIFEFQILKENVTYSTNVSIQIIEIDLPQLYIEGPDQNRIFNYYDEFIYKLAYPGINPDVLIYAGAVIYNSIVEASFQFYYLEFKFKLQNYFTDLNLGNIVKLRLSIYDPRFVMPSLNTLILRMNIPPQNCFLEIKKPDVFIEFIDILQVEVLGCDDNSEKLLYSIQLFPNQSIYQSDLVTSKFNNYILLFPFSEQNKFSFTLPYLSNQDCFLVFHIQDQNMGITNLTYSLSVRKYQNLDSGTFKQFEKEFQSFNQKLIGYNIISERIKSINSQEKYIQNLYELLLLIDTQQSFLVNQTETLYKSISNLLSFNSTLLNSDENTLFDNLQYRIYQANNQLNEIFTQQLLMNITSEQNLIKLELIKQYYTFSSILSSCIKQKVNQNMTSQKYQTLIKVIQSQLQNVSVANEPLYKIPQNSIHQDIGFITTKLAEQLTGTNQTSKRRILNTEINSTNFYKYSMTRYKDNPFYMDEKFPKNSSGFQAIDPKIEIQNSSNNQMVGENMKFRFTNEKELAKNSSLKCITKLESGEWNADICKTDIKENETICECESLNPTSIMEQLDFISDKLSETFSVSTLLLFGQFPFYKASIFYLYVIVTIIYLYAVYWGMKVDKEFYEKIHIEKELAEQKEKEQQEQLKLGKEEREKEIKEDLEIQNEDQQIKKKEFEEKEEQVIEQFQTINEQEKDSKGNESKNQIIFENQDQLQSSERFSSDDFQENYVKTSFEYQQVTQQNEQLIQIFESKQLSQKSIPQNSQEQDDTQKDQSFNESVQLQIFRIQDEYPNENDEVKERDNLTEQEVQSQSNMFSNSPSYDRIQVLSPPQEILNSDQNYDFQNSQAEGQISNSNNCIFTVLNSQKTVIQQEEQLQNQQNIENVQIIEENEQIIEENKLENSGIQTQAKQESSKIKTLKQKLKAYLQYLKYFHQILAIVYKSDEQKPRALRASIVYTSIVGSFAVLFIFNQPENLSFNLSLTVLTAPANKIYQLILEKLLSHQKSQARIIGAIIMIIVAGLQSYIMLAGLVLLDSLETANKWSYIFLGAFSADNLFYCPIQLFGQYLVQMELFKMPRFQKFLDKVLEKKAKEFLQKLIDNLGIDDE